jgi:hypothetical protein
MNGFKSLPKEYSEHLAAIVCMGHYVKPTGSRVTESGWNPFQSDYDFVVLDPDRTLAHSLEKNIEWYQGGSGNGSEFTSYKHDNLNLILVDTKDVFNKYVAATEAIKVLNCKTKEERIAVFDSIFCPPKGVLPF